MATRLNNGNDVNLMEREPSKREQKRDSARKHKERAVYTKKAVRIKEAQREKFVSRHGQGSTSD